jgi:carboxymethylenebutenolidase
MMDRRAVLAALAGTSTLHAALAQTREELNVGTDEGDMIVTRCATNRPGKRSCVLVLHGSRGPELAPRAYARYADALTSAGIDVYLLHYFTMADNQALDPKATTKEDRGAYNARRFSGWARRASSVATAILTRPDTSGHIGLLGFSLGGYVAAATAAQDNRVAALAVLYGGMPDDLVPHVKRLPPLIELHGEADRVVPAAKGVELVKLAQSLGAKADLVTYAGKDHGFDFSDTDPMTADAVKRVTQFFQGYLGVA